jgi:hypothetical protein
MARFSQAFLQGLLQPTYQQGLFEAAKGLGQTPAIMDLQRQEREQKQKLADIYSTAMQPGTTSVQMFQAAQQLMAQGETKEALALLAQARELQETEKQPKTRAEYFAQNPKDQAALYENFTAESINKYINNSGPLVPLNPEESDPLSAHGKRLIDAGYTKGSPEYIKAMKDYNDSIVSGKAQGLAYKGELEQTQFLEEQLQNNPFRSQYESILQKVNSVKAIEKNILKGDSEGLRLLERTVSELFNSDTRAASEISRLLEGRGIARNFVDRVSELAGEGMSNETKNKLIDIVKSMEELAVFYNNLSVTTISESYGQFVDEDVKNAFESRYSSTNFFKRTEEEQNMPPLPSGAVLDITDNNNS